MHWIPQSTVPAQGSLYWGVHSRSPPTPPPPNSSKWVSWYASYCKNKTIMCYFCRGREGHRHSPVNVHASQVAQHTALLCMYRDHFSWATIKHWLPKHLWHHTYEDPKTVSECFKTTPRRLKVMGYACRTHAHHRFPPKSKETCIKVQRNFINSGGLTAMVTRGHSLPATHTNDNHYN